MTGAAFNKGKSETSVETPREFIEIFEYRFGNITFDLAADMYNTKAYGYFNKEMDSLSQDWDVLPRGTNWLNPPYDDIKPWVEKCSHYNGGGIIATLIPASIGSNWFRDYVYKKSMVTALNGRLKFVGHSSPYPKDLILAVYGMTQVGFEVWNWKENIKTA